MGQWENVLVRKCLTLASSRPAARSSGGQLMPEPFPKARPRVVEDTVNQLRRVNRLKRPGKIDSRIVLIDGPTLALARLMVDNSVGVSPVSSYALLKIDSDYFAEE
jgi:hypothetical protein